MTTSELSTLVTPTVAIDVTLTTDNLLTLADELCVDTVSICDEVVTFTARRGEQVTRWQGVIGERGIVRL